uniref:oxoglutarate dehydrogenase (succinyl-transferring) n=1 Tax=Conchiformibius kuhniae TaxID=211502 RepID=A0A8T9MXG5_9NEIS|nr:hypothetical protein LVJ77_02140 [Conchiformibius kuhniae]
MNYLIQNAGKDGVEEVVIGMAHRGRLNVLVNTLGKKPADLFAEFEGRAEATLPSGDVKYHMGFSSDIATPHGAMHVTLAFNPRIWKSSIPWWKARYAPSSAAVVRTVVPKCCPC